MRSLTILGEVNGGTPLWGVERIRREMKQMREEYLDVIIEQGLSVLQVGGTADEKELREKYSLSREIKVFRAVELCEDEDGESFMSFAREGFWVLLLGTTSRPVRKGRRLLRRQVFPICPGFRKKEIDSFEHLYVVPLLSSQIDEIICRFVDEDEDELVQGEYDLDTALALY